MILSFGQSQDNCCSQCITARTTERHHRSCKCSHFLSFHVKTKTSFFIEIFCQTITFSRSLSTFIFENPIFQQCEEGKTLVKYSPIASRLIGSQILETDNQFNQICLLNIQKQQIKIHMFMLSVGYSYHGYASKVIQIL